jgi:ABC-type amino acid transport system permease subunit
MNVLIAILCATVGTLLFHFWSHVIMRHIETKRKIDILDNRKTYILATLGTAMLTAFSGMPAFIFIAFLFTGKG